MAVLVVLVLLSAFTCSSDGANWCVCRSDVSDTSLQKTLDYACGAGADCTPIIQNGACYQPNTVRAHCSYAANSYFQRKGQIQGSCDFAGTATITTTDPSPSSTCAFPSSASGAGTTPSVTTPGTTPVLTPPTGINTPTPLLGGTSISPTGLTDVNSGGFYSKVNMGIICLALYLPSLVLLRG